MIAIIQARSNSTRLPYKIFYKLPFDSKITMLEQIIYRLQQSKNIDKIIIATTTLDDDTIICKCAENNDINYFRGSSDDVLSRFFYSAIRYNAKHILRICADSPFFDSKIIDKYIDIHLSEKNDYTGTFNFPIGTNIEIFSFDLLSFTYVNTNDEKDKEHVSPFMKKLKDNRFKISFYEAEEQYRNYDLRLTIDTKQDYSFACCIYDYLYKKNKYFSLKDVMNIINKKPYLTYINKDIKQKEIK